MNVNEHCHHCTHEYACYLNMHCHFEVEHAYRVVCENNVSRVYLIVIRFILCN